MFPTGCGKGHDTAVLGAWLNDLCQTVELASVEASRPLSYGYNQGALDQMNQILAMLAFRV